MMSATIFTVSPVRTIAQKHTETNVRSLEGVRQRVSNKRCVVVKSASPQDMGKRVFGSSLMLSSFSSVLPALAIVDDRLNGDGTGLPLGINDGALGIILATVPLAVFSLYFIAGKQDASIVAGGKDDDSGLSL